MGYPQITEMPNALSNNFALKPSLFPFALGIGARNPQARLCRLALTAKSGQ
jgi:hypothetical protein